MVTIPVDVDIHIDEDALREQVKDKYREVALEPQGTYHFHTGRPLAASPSGFCGPERWVDRLGLAETCRAPPALRRYFGDPGPDARPDGEPPGRSRAHA